MANDKYTIENGQRLIDALKKCLGIKSQAAAMCGYERHIIDRWARVHPEFKEALDEVVEMQKDFVEAKFLQLIRDGETSCIIHYMKTKCRDRGYGHNLDITTGGDKIDRVIEIVVNKE